ncbi:hypothetical protein SAY87_025504 [Trapa incisa]|uniref:Transcription factor CBF/NF-Y/archaeal histone domain-containing protein n=2 Tax=Trapa TaxID=22665 RepID=A0AAN7R5I5_TRANT|nr:hypothetical protein SAY87_025504 [Trapa incisa]KAK4789065.1 hypothetical protein SAY86_020384 [Trapa natans]
MESSQMPKVVAEVDELPKAIVRRVVKEKLSRCSDAGDIALHKDALLAFTESARIFIHYLSATANDVTKESRRQTITADDVLKAIQEIEFPEFIGPLKSSLEEFRRKNAGKRAEASKAKELKKRKNDGESSEMKDDGKRQKGASDNEQGDANGDATDE